MKTSLNLLRATAACVGGYGRQASFWSVRPAAKAIEYPIWMIGLIGNYEDLQWALTNSLIVDDEDFKELKARTFWPVFQYLLWTSISADYILKMSKKKVGDFQRDALQDVLAVRNAEDAQAWMDKYSRYKIANILFNRVSNHRCWNDPQSYLSLLTEAVHCTKSDLCLEHERFPFNLDSHVPGHDSRTGIATKKSAARPSRYRRDDDADDDYSSRPKKTKKEAVDEKSKSYFDLPEFTGRQPTKGETFAFVCLNRDPWPVALQFLMDKNVPQIVGSKMQLSKVSEDGKEPEKFHATLNLFDPRQIFIIMHLMQAHDFDVLRACGVEPKADRLEYILDRFGPGRSLDDLNAVVDDVHGEWSNAPSRIIAETEDIDRQLADDSAIRGAIRERQAIATSHGDDYDGSESDNEEEDEEG